MAAPLKTTRTRRLKTQKIYNRKHKRDIRKEMRRVIKNPAHERPGGISGHRRRIQYKRKKLAVDRIAMYVAIAEKIAFEMTLEEWKKYKKEHPAAERKNHQVIIPKHEIKTKVHQNKVVPKREELHRVLSKGHYSIISAGKNDKNTDEKDKDPNDEFFAKRHEELQKEIDTLGVPYCEIVGHYSGQERSFLLIHDDEELPKTPSKAVMVSYKKDNADKIKKSLDDLGKKYKQNSVLHGAEGKNTIHFTTGEHEGKECGGEGWKETPEATDYYTDAQLSGREHSKFNVDIQECFEKGYL